MQFVCCCFLDSVSAAPAVPKDSLRFDANRGSTFCNAFDAVKERDTSGKAKERFKLLSSFCFLSLEEFSSTSSSSWRTCLLEEELDLVSLRFKKSLSTHFSSWIECSERITSFPLREKPTLGLLLLFSQR
ncbi:hypothetical protein OIU74_022501 [Salix koriyanagi]|uniref:Uncharacterized protein n=1 Tax=Salix koriyanagi TaxID=2511006 RepID=A0A9Q1AF37_9ROSI|nr:hypothetical protein OIU74_022501 [Salix koriyanagi]